MEIKDKVYIKNHKCFGPNGSGFDQGFKPINIIIGKNNSGKSSLIELVEFLCLSNTDKFDTNTTIEVERQLTAKDIAKGFRKGRIIGNINEYSHGLTLVGVNCRFSIDKRNNYTFISIDRDKSPSPQEAEPLQTMVSNFKLHFSSKKIRKLTAERDIVPEKDFTSDNNDYDIDFKPNGENATRFIHSIINKTTYESKLIEKELLKALNKIVNPDIDFKRILVQQDDKDEWEIYFDDIYENRVALSKMGSGIKTILLVLLNILVIPELSSIQKSKYIFAFEELENNLHPAMQRRLYKYIENYSKENQSYFFLTTHSNIVIDRFGKKENSQFIQVSNNGKHSTTKTLLSIEETKDALDELGIKASDLLQSNGVIWVEGPSDRVYLNKWIGLLGPDLEEGLHYSIIPYGGASLLPNAKFDYELFEKDVIPVLRINTNAYLIMDSDLNDSNSESHKTKLKAAKEIGDGNFWITKGREIENYLQNEVVKNWLKSKPGSGYKGFNNTLYRRFEASILIAGEKNVKYEKNKKKYAQEISEHIKPESLDYLDLREKVDELINKIKVWNS